MLSIPNATAASFVALIFTVMVVVAFLLPIISLIYCIVKAVSSKYYKRTSLGEELTEQIYGMKNFIHDFSDLSHADKEKLVLWDDFLIYAVLLEENRSIVTEICSMRHVNISRTML